MTVVENCLLSNIAVNPLNIRRDLGDLTELKASIAEQGILQPLIVAPTYQDGTETHGQPPFVLIDGERRLTAAREAGLERTTVIVRDDLLDQESQVEAMLVTALQRADITPVEEAHAYTQLLAFDGVTAQKIAKATGRSIDTVKQRVKLTKLPERVQEKLHTQQVSLTDVMAIVEFADDPDAVNELEHALGHSYNFLHTLTRLRDRKEAVKRAAKSRRDLAKAGVLVVDRPDGYPYSSDEKPLYRIGISLEEHASCPGHVAIIERSGEPEFLCQDPATHHADSSDDDEPGLTPEDIEREKQREATKEALELAEKSRATFVEPYLSGGTKLPDQALGLCLALEAIYNSDVEDVVAFLGWTPPSDVETDHEDYTTWFIAQMVKATPSTLHRVVMRDLVSMTSYYLGKWHNWTEPVAQAYLTFLVDIGYPITPEEQAKAFPAPVEELAGATS